MKSALWTVVTGGVRGIGLALVKELLLRGRRNIFVIDQVPESKLPQSFLRLKTQYARCDLQDSQELLKVLKSHQKVFSRAEILINNAGYGGPFEILENVELSQLTAVFSVNFTSPFILTKAVLPGMRKRKFGRILNVSSLQGFLGNPGSTAYCSSKHALIGLTRTTAAEYGRFGVTANAICPGYVDTSMGASKRNPIVQGYRKRVLSRTPANSTASPQEIASFMTDIVLRQTNYFNGAVIPFDGGISAVVGV
jgi:3-oxoacyl-[acyl-carrier protein] reductase